MTAGTGEQLADKALAAFVIIHAMLKRSKRLHSYCQRPEILERMPGYSVRAFTYALLDAPSPPYELSIHGWAPGAPGASNLAPRHRFLLKLHRLALDKNFVTYYIQCVPSDS